MTKPNYTEIVLIVDSSGSMGRIQADTEGGINTFIEEQKKVPGECKVTLVTFSTRHKEQYVGKDIAEVPKFTLVPSGNTSLLDAIGHTINTVGARLSSLKEEERPSKVIFVISTDGEENSSREFNRTQVFEMIQHQTNKYSWDFVFLGANQDAIAVGNSLGISAQRSVTYAANSIGTQGLYRGLSAAIGSSRLSGQSVSYNQDAYQASVADIISENNKVNSNLQAP